MIEIILFIILIFYSIYITKKYLQLKFIKKSIEIKTGKWMQHWFPFMKNFPFDVTKCKFLGEPIDMVYFGDEKICFMEFKTGKSRLSWKQEMIKSLVNSKKVDWMEIDIR